MRDVEKMTAEQLEELLGKVLSVGSFCVKSSDVEIMIRKLIHAERVIIVAQSLTDAILSGRDVYGWADSLCQEITTYREASK